MSALSRSLCRLCNPLVLVLAGVGGPPALAQQAGVYVGTSSQGGQVEVYVDEAPEGGLVLSVMGHQILSTCDAGANKRDWWYIPLFGAPIDVDPVASELRATFIYEYSVLQFTPDGSALVGSYNITTPAFVDRNPRHWATARCITGPVTFRAVWQPPSEVSTRKRAQLPKGRAPWAARADAQGRIQGWTADASVR
jgi:hypothetical protein